MLFLDNLATLQPELMILVQKTLKFCQIWYNWPKLKNLTGNTAWDLWITSPVPLGHRSLHSQAGLR